MQVGCRACDRTTQPSAGTLRGVLRGCCVDMVCVPSCLSVYMREREPAVTPFCIVDEGALKATWRREPLFQPAVTHLLTQHL